MFGYCVRMQSPFFNILQNDVRKFSVRYGCGELIWYLNPYASMDQICHYAPSYRKFADDNSSFYGPRIHDQIFQVAQELRGARHSRRGVISIWDKSDLERTDRKDIPCTCTWKFYSQDGFLNMIADMRSNDAWLGMPNDIFVNTCIHLLMCKLTCLTPGYYQHQVGDMHLYEKDYDKAVAALEERSSSTSVPFTSAIINPIDIEELVAAEQFLRTEGICRKLNDDVLNFFLESCV